MKFSLKTSFASQLRTASYLVDGYNAQTTLYLANATVASTKKMTRDLAQCFGKDASLFKANSHWQDVPGGAQIEFHYIAISANIAAEFEKTFARFVTLSPESRAFIELYNRSNKKENGDYFDVVNPNPGNVANPSLNGSILKPTPDKTEELIQYYASKMSDSCTLSKADKERFDTLVTLLPNIGRARTKA